MANPKKFFDENWRNTNRDKDAASYNHWAGMIAISEQLNRIEGRLEEIQRALQNLEARR